MRGRTSTSGLKFLYINNKTKFQRLCYTYNKSLETTTKNIAAKTHSQRLVSLCCTRTVCPTPTHFGYLISQNTKTFLLLIRVRTRKCSYHFNILSRWSPAACAGWTRGQLCKRGRSGYVYCHCAVRISGHAGNSGSGGAGSRGRRYWGFFLYQLAGAWLSFSCKMLYPGIPTYRIPSSSSSLLVGRFSKVLVAKLGPIVAALTGCKTLASYYLSLHLPSLHLKFYWVLQELEHQDHRATWVR